MFSSLISLLAFTFLIFMASCATPQPPESKSQQPTTVAKQTPVSTCPPCSINGDNGAADEEEDNGTSVNYWDNSLYHEMDDVDLSALGDISQNDVFGRFCRICPPFLLRCPCPPFFRCVLVPRTCTRCAYYRCVPRIPIPIHTLPIPTVIPTIPFPDPWEYY
jgi:hypothetical protein